MNRPVQSEEDLRYWLAHEDWYMSSHTREWLERTPTGQAAAVLERIARDADPEPAATTRSVLMGILNAFSVSGELGRKDIQKRNAGARAAIMLADNLDDARCIPPLVRVFQTDGRRQSKYQELVETALTRFLSEASGPEIAPYAEDIRSLAERIREFSGGQRDLSPVFTDLLLAALRCLRALGGEPDLALLRAIAEAPETKPNRLRAKQAARALLGT
jgi:hypothetical protein